MIQSTSPIVVRRVLLVKTSSMGDLVHTLSAIEEARQHCPGLSVDWVCEEAFRDIPQLSSAVNRVIPLAIRRWRKSWLGATTRAEIRVFLSQLRATEYDLVIDAQGLIKSAWVTAAARCPRQRRWGFDWSTIREPLASLAVGRKVHAPADWHAIERLRILFGKALGYAPTGVAPVLNHPAALTNSADPQGRNEKDRSSTILFLHGTSRQEKSWPIDAWSALGRNLAADGYRLQLPWGSPTEHDTALQIANAIGESAVVLPKMPIGELAQALIHADGAIGVDSGLMHLSVALGRPTVAVMTASHLPKFAATRFAPFWAAHARVVERESAQQQIQPADVRLAWHQLAPR